VSVVVETPINDERSDPSLSRWSSRVLADYPGLGRAHDDLLIQFGNRRTDRIDLLHVGR